MAWFFHEQRAICYLGTTLKCQHRGNLMVLRRIERGYRYAGDPNPFAGGAATWEHVMPRPMRLARHASLLLLACADCNHAKGCAPPEPEHVERALELGLRWAQAPIFGQVESLRLRYVAQLQASYDHYLRMRDSYGMKKALERKQANNHGAKLPEIEMPVPKTAAEAIAQGVGKPKSSKSRKKYKPRTLEQEREFMAGVKTAADDIDRRKRAAALGVTDHRFLPAAGTGEHATEDNRALKNAKSEAAALRHIADQHRKQGDESQANAISAKAWAILDAVRGDKPKGRGT